MTLLKAIGWYQLITGISMLFFIWTDFGSQLSLWTLPIFGIMVIISVFIIYAGYKILMEPLKGLKLSIFAQLIQSIGIAVPSFIFYCTSASYASIIISDQINGFRLSTKYVSIIMMYNKNSVSWSGEIFIIPIIITFILFYEGFKIEKTNQ